MDLVHLNHVNIAYKLLYRGFMTDVKEACFFACLTTEKLHRRYERLQLAPLLVGPEVLQVLFLHLPWHSLPQSPSSSCCLESSLLSAISVSYSEPHSDCHHGWEKLILYSTSISAHIFVNNVVKCCKIFYNVKLWDQFWLGLYAYSVFHFHSHVMTSQ